MGNNRFEIIYESSAVTHIETCPVIIVGIRLMYDQVKKDSVVQLKFKNIMETTIVSINVEIIDEKKNIKHNFDYCNLNIKRDDCFGEQVPIYLNDMSSKSLTIQVSKVKYIENNKENIWVNTKNLKTYTIKNSTLEDRLSTDLIDQYYRETNCSSNDKWVPNDYGDIWVCSCGGINISNENECHICKKTWKNLELILDEEYLRKRAAEYNLKLQKQKDFQEQQIKKRNKSFFKIGSVFILILFLVFGIIMPKVDNAQKKDFAKKFNDDMYDFYKQEVFDNHGRDLTDEEIGDNSDYVDDDENYTSYGHKDYEIGGVDGTISYEYDNRYRPYVTTICWYPNTDDEKQLRYIKYAFSCLGVSGKKPKKEKSSSDEDVDYYTFKKDDSFITSSSDDYNEAVLTVRKSRSGEISSLDITWEENYNY